MNGKEKEYVVNVEVATTHTVPVMAKTEAKAREIIETLLNDRSAEEVDAELEGEFGHRHLQDGMYWNVIQDNSYDWEIAEQELLGEVSA